MIPWNAPGAMLSSWLSFNPRYCRVFVKLKVSFGIELILLLPRLTCTRSSISVILSGTRVNELLPKLNNVVALTFG